MVPGYNCGSHAFLKTQTSLILHSALACFPRPQNRGWASGVRVNQATQSLFSTEFSY